MLVDPAGLTCTPWDSTEQQSKPEPMWQSYFKVGTIRCYATGIFVQGWNHDFKPSSDLYRSSE
jgi:hypothetical protein